MSDGLNAVSVLRMHLEELERTLLNVEGMLVSQDLRDQYIKMETLTRPSRLTTKVTAQLDRVRGYLQEEDVSQE